MTIGYRGGVIVSGAIGLLNRLGGVPVTMVLPETISYTSNAVTGRSATKTITFRYDGTPGRNIVKLKSGVPIATGVSLLTSIEASAPDPVKPAIVTTYKLHYEAPSITGRSLLTRIQRCGRDGACMQPTQFDWEPGSYDFRKVISDVDDSHRPDLVYDPHLYVRAMRSRFWSPPTSTATAETISSIGRPCWARPSRSLQNTRIKVRLGGPNGFGPPIDTGIPTIVIPEDAEQFSGNIFFEPIPVDINGDGRTDLALGQIFPHVPSGPRLFDIFLNNGSGVFTRQPVGLSQDNAWDPAFNPEAAGVSIVGFFMPGDYDGDGRMDVARKYNNTTFGIRRNVNGALVNNYISPTLSVAGVTIPVPWDNNRFGVMTADVDGDGRTEVVMGGDTPGAVHDDPHSDVDGVLTNLTGIKPAGLANFFAGRRIDLNGDGLPDIIVKQNDPQFPPRKLARIWVNLGRTSATRNDFIPVVDLNSNQQIPDTYNIDLVDGVIADLNDDGMDDVFVPAGCNTLESKMYISRGDGNFTKVPLNVDRGFFFEPDPLEHPEIQVCHRLLMDVDGDGQLDFVQPESGTVENPITQAGRLRIYFRTGKKPDRIKGILNGIGANTTIEYGRAGLDTGGAGTCQYPKGCSGRQVEVVSGYTISEGRVAAGQTNTTHYLMAYAGSTADVLRKEWLGFTRVDRTNDRTRVKEMKFYDMTTRIGNWYPHVGMPTVVMTEYNLAGTGRRIAHRRQTTFTAIRSNSADVLGPT